MPVYIITGWFFSSGTSLITGDRERIRQAQIETFGGLLPDTSLMKRSVFRQIFLLRKVIATNLIKGLRNGYYRLIKAFVQDKRYIGGHYLCLFEQLVREENEQEITILEKELQNILVKNLSIIESGLKLYEGEENGKNGLEYPVDGRRIDILAMDKNDNFVVIELKVSRGYDRVVGQLLRYKNWIKRNIAENNQNVRGVIICKKVTDDLLLACDGLDNIELFKYELDIKIHKRVIEK